MKFVNAILYIEFQELIDAGVSGGTLKSAQHRASSSWTFIDDPEDKRKVLIEYEALKNQYKQLVIDKLCGGVIPYIYMQTQIINRELFNKPEDIERIFRHNLKDSTRDRVLECVKYLHLIERYRLASDKKKAFPMWNIDEWWINVIAHAKANVVLRQKNGVNLPLARPRLNHLAKQYANHGPLVVLSGRLGNKNSSKLGKLNDSSEFNQDIYRKQIALMMELRAHANNLDFVQIADHYNYAAKQANWPTLCPAQVGNILKDGTIDLITSAGRTGISTYRNTKALQVKRRVPERPLDFVTIDGWDVELAYQETATDRKGTRRTRYDNRLVVVILLDPFMKYPLGYAIDVNESVDLNKRAVKNAIDHIRELTGEYYAPYQLQSDNYGRGSLKEFYSSIAHVYTPAAIGNARAKVIEPYFRYLNKKYCQLLDNWTGFGIKSRRENQPNREMKDKIKTSFPDRAGVILQIEEMIAAERQIKGPEYLQALVTTEKRLMTRADYLKVLGTLKERTIKANGKGLIMQVAGAEYTYDTLDLHFREHLNRDWQVHYDPQDMETILIEADNGSTKFILEEKYVQPMGIVDQTTEDTRRLLQIRGANKALEGVIIEKRTENRELVEDLMSEVPALAEFRQKLMFTVRGQQKDPLQEAKGKKTLSKTPDPEFDEEAWERHMQTLEKKLRAGNANPDPEH